MCELDRELENLLAIIHRDGGHHTGRVGLEQSVKDAHQVWAEHVQLLDEAASMLEEYRQNYGSPGMTTKAADIRSRILKALK